MTPWEFERNCPRRWWGVLLAEREERINAKKEAGRVNDWAQRKLKEFNR